MTNKILYECDILESKEYDRDALCTSKFDFLFLSPPFLYKCHKIVFDNSSFLYEYVASVKLLDLKKKYIITININENNELYCSSAKELENHNKRQHKVIESLSDYFINTDFIEQLIKFSQEFLNDMQHSTE